MGSRDATAGERGPVYADRMPDVIAPTALSARTTHAAVRVTEATESRHAATPPNVARIPVAGRARLLTDDYDCWTLVFSNRRLIYRCTTAAPTASPQTFVAVRKRSRNQSTASSSPMPSTGRPTTCNTMIIVTSPAPPMVEPYPAPDRVHAPDAAAEIDGRRLTDMEFHLFFVMLVDAGGDTTRNLVAGGLLALLEALVREEGGTMLMATHSPAVAASCDRIVEVQNGRLVEAGA